MLQPASIKLTKHGGEHLYTCVNAPVTVLRLYLQYAVASILLQAVAASKTSAEHSTVAFTMQTRG